VVLTGSHDSLIGHKQRVSQKEDKLPRNWTAVYAESSLLFQRGILPYSVQVDRFIDSLFFAG